MRTLIRILGLAVLLGFTACSAPKRTVAQAEPVAQAEAHVSALRKSGLAPAGLRGLEVQDVRRIHPLATSGLQPRPRPYWWAELRCADGSAGYLAWGDDGRLVDFCLEGVVAVEGSDAFALPGVPPIQQFPLAGPDGALVASGCVPTAGASLIAYWAGRPATAAWGASDETKLVLRLRSRMRMVVLPDVDGHADGKMALAGAFPTDLALAMQADAVARGIEVHVELTGYERTLLAAELAEGRPVLLSCVVLLPRKPELSWGHEVVAVGRAEVAGASSVGVIDNFFTPRVPGTIRWIA
jgi:hypothetical protein